jgi:hypothetical protein
MIMTVMEMMMMPNDPHSAIAITFKPTPLQGNPTYVSPCLLHTGGSRNTMQQTKQNAVWQSKKQHAFRIPHHVCGCMTL